MKYLVWVAGAFPVGKIFESYRQYDIALNNFDGDEIWSTDADFCFIDKGEKWQSIAKIIPRLDRIYDAYCFLDDDIEITTEQLNLLLNCGIEKGFDIWQASLTPDSIYGWPHTVSQGRGCRYVPFVEIMMPCFHSSALDACLHTFTENYSGWGIDFLWPKCIPQGRFGIFDDIAVAHRRPVQSRDRIHPNGKKALEECHDLALKYDLRGRQYGNFSRDIA